MFAKHSLHHHFNFILIVKLFKSFLQPTDFTTEFLSIFQTLTLAIIIPLNLHILTFNSIKQICIFNFNFIEILILCNFKVCCFEIIYLLVFLVLCLPKLTNRFYLNNKCFNHPFWHNSVLYIYCFRIHPRLFSLVSSVFQSVLQYIFICK